MNKYKLKKLISDTIKKHNLELTLKHPDYIMQRYGETDEEFFQRTKEDKE